MPPLHEFVPFGFGNDIPDLIVRQSHEHFEIGGHELFDRRLDGRVRKIGAAVALDATHAQLRIQLARHERNFQKRFAM